MPEPLGTDETLDVLCNDNVQVVQKKKGYRLSMDPLLLANFVRLKAKETLLDVGTGCGIIPIYLAKKGHANRMVGMEIQDELYRLSLRNKELNACANVEFLRGDITVPDKKLGCFHVIVSNPPYVKAKAGRNCPDTSRLLARSETALDLESLTSVACSRLYTRGRLYVIYPARRLSELMFTTKSKGLEPKRIRFVHSRAEEPAILFLMECMKGGRADLTVESPLCIYSADDYTQEVKAYYA